MKFVIKGAPRTKKTSQRIFRTKGGKPFVMPSALSRSWEDSAVLQLRSQLMRAPSSIPAVILPYFCGPVCIDAKVYREAARGDWTGYVQAIADALEASGVIQNDRLISHWDGTRLLVDRKNPRVELEVRSIP